MAWASTEDDSRALVIFHQCMQQEWENDGWGRQSADEFARAGCVVVRVKTEPWQDLKCRNPDAFRNPLKVDLHVKESGPVSRGSAGSDN